MRAKKSLGQHFLRCQWVVNTLIRAAELTLKDTVLEIGPGAGVLTRALAHAAGRVIAVEKDERLTATLVESLKQDGIKNVEVVSGDILRLIPSSLYLAKQGTESYKIVANIPYYLTSRLLRLLLQQQAQLELIVLTVQKEVASRIVACPPHMNLLALSVQAFGKPEIIKIVPASCFSPTPKVDSAIIKISDISDDFFQENELDKNEFFSIIRRAFSQKRKLLTNTIGAPKSAGDKKRIAAILLRLGLSANARPEELSLKNWADLTKKLL